MSRTLAELKDQGQEYLEDQPGSGLSGLLAELKIMIGGVSKQMSEAEKDRQQLNRNIYPIDIPAQSATVASTNVSIANSELLGPRTGILWDVQRLTVYGLNSNSESVKVFKSAVGSSAGQVAQNFVCTLIPVAGQGTGADGAFQTFGKGGLVIRAGESLQVTGTGLTNGEIITFTGQALSVAMPFVGEYFI